MKERVAMPVLCVFLASLLGCGKVTSPVPPAADVFMIDYVHEASGVFYHGTFSLTGTRVNATWTTDRGGKKETRDVPMSEATFRDLWDSLSDLDDFKNGAAKDPDRQVDPRTQHVVAIA